MSCQSEELQCLPKVAYDDSGVKGHLKVRFRYVCNFCHISVMLLKFDLVGECHIIPRNFII